METVLQIIEMMPVALVLLVMGILILSLGRGAP